MLELLPQRVWFCAFILNPKFAQCLQPALARHSQKERTRDHLSTHGSRQGPSLRRISFAYSSRACKQSGGLACLLCVCEDDEQIFNSKRTRVRIGSVLRRRSRAKHIATQKRHARTHSKQGKESPAHVSKCEPSKQTAQGNHGKLALFMIDSCVTSIHPVG